MQAAAISSKHFLNTSNNLKMPDKSEKEKRKEIMNELRKKAEEEFENSLPMSRGNFKKMFDFLDKYLSENDCDHTTALTETFLTQNNIVDKNNILSWLKSKGGQCDCEILANVEEQFE